MSARFIELTPGIEKVPALVIRQYSFSDSGTSL
ncbi:hypothetical protein VPHK449_0101 [Vibrio phage K449]